MDEWMDETNLFGEIGASTAQRYRLEIKTSNYNYSEHKNLPEIFVIFVTMGKKKNIFWQFAFVLICFVVYVYAETKKQRNRYISLASVWRTISSHDLDLNRVRNINSLTQIIKIVYLSFFIDFLYNSFDSFRFHLCFLK